MTARILVVDDITANLRLLEAKLLNEYYDVTLAASGREALTAVARSAPDVILLDVMMPEMDGYEVCRRLKADPATAHIPVVMVTALVDQAERVRGLEVGADDFLSKPVDDATLFGRLRALLRVKQVQDAWRLQGETARALGFDPPADPEAQVAGARVLVVGEDGEEIVAVTATLAADGILARGAAGARALDTLAEGGFDLAVICLTGTGVQELRLASRLRAQGVTRDLPMLLVADRAQRDLVLRGFELGANDHVLRPVDPNELRARSRNQIRRRRYQEKLQEELDRSLQMAVTDPLTGLRNRRYLLRHLEAVLCGGDAAVLLLDVDRFKPINDHHGHAAGDAALYEVAQRLKTHLRAADVVARYGGEEFVVVLAGAPKEYALNVAERLRLALSSTAIPAGGLNLAVTASIGLAMVPAGSTAEAAISAADAALYRAKAQGRDRVEMARPGDFILGAGPAVAPNPLRRA
ncbi:PleD family two-component system response regulator [Siccirubricoccus sp. KC 17139]|uniref:diguanylate cyclase n=1 Tax=Siccirubricoccus soli TaxID=2899147 RepID=A0ABT1D7Z0_9PROT|nr:PleD family two-component system response regulator [Siccirubricoccus soli]MCO6418063.1 PleD family two-component system response regulator [Siccirubricoccus soli]MCP2684198.1 PleD family two-component system response regulator [Siccirubricoccus soli]